MDSLGNVSWASDIDWLDFIIIIHFIWKVKKEPFSKILSCTKAVVINFGGATCSKKYRLHFCLYSLIGHLLSAFAEIWSPVFLGAWCPWWVWYTLDPSAKSQLLISFSHIIIFLGGKKEKKKKHHSPNQISCFVDQLLISNKGLFWHRGLAN